MNDKRRYALWSAAAESRWNRDGDAALANGQADDGSGAIESGVGALRALPPHSICR